MNMINFNEAKFILRLYTLIEVFYLKKQQTKKKEIAKSRDYKRGCILVYKEFQKVICLGENYIQSQNVSEKIVYKVP